VSGVVTVRRFELRDLDAAARFSDAARALDEYVEPFGQRLAVIATGSRAALDLWRVAAGEDQGLYGIAFSALRESAPGPLSEPALSARARLRARVRDDAFAGRAFATALGFVETGAQLSLQWGGGKVEVARMPALRVRAATRRDEQALRKLSSEAWVDTVEANFSRADEIAQLFAEEGRLVLLAESEGKPMGYLSAVQLGRTLGIEEVAVLPQFRRMGVGRGLLAHAMAKAQGAVLSVSEANRPARALYRSLGFRQTARRLVLERR